MLRRMRSWTTPTLDRIAASHEAQGGPQQKNNENFNHCTILSCNVS
jgi:hypothetical protein